MPKGVESSERQVAMLRCWRLHEGCGVYGAVFPYAAGPAAELYVVI